MPAILPVWRLKVQYVMDAGLGAKSQLLMLNIQILQANRDAFMILNTGR